MGKKRRPAPSSSLDNPTVPGRQGFELHPGAALDITNIWLFIAEDNLVAAKRVREEILDCIRGLVRFPTKDIEVQTLLPGHFFFRLYAVISLPTRRVRSRLL
jgi:plasmid stabilization system protein ParE